MNVMVDLETRGTVPGCIILSIGAVAYSTRSGELGKEFYTVVSTPSCKEAFLFEQADTMAWWGKQSEQARAVLRQSEMDSAPTLRDALTYFNNWLASLGDKKNLYVYGNGADFDNPLLASAYHAVGMKQGWASYNGRCYRTLKSLPAVLGLTCPPIQRGTGTHHNALDDAKAQALHAIEIMKVLHGAVK